MPLEVATPNSNHVCTWRRRSARQRRASYKPLLHCQWRWKNDQLGTTIRSGCLWVSYSLTRFLLDSWTTGKPFMREAGELLWVGVVVPRAPRLCADVNVNTVLVKSPLAVQLGSCTETQGRRTLVVCLTICQRMLSTINWTSSPKGEGQAIGVWTTGWA